MWRHERRILSQGLGAAKSKTIVDRYLLTSTPEGLLIEFQQQPPKQRLETLLALYRDLVLKRITEATQIARARNLVTESQLEPSIARLGELAVPRILDLIEEFGFGAPFNRPEDVPTLGAFTSEMCLATNCAFLIVQCRVVTDSDVRRIQRLIARRVESDRERPMAATLAENLARALHQLRPKQFPQTILNPKTNHLDNPDPFLP